MAVKTEETIFKTLKDVKELCESNSEDKYMPQIVNEFLKATAKKAEEVEFLLKELLNSKEKEKIELREALLHIRAHVKSRRIKGFDKCFDLDSESGGIILSFAEKALEKTKR